MTTNENSYREKGRAVFLAALMVLSVVAMSTAFVGGAAATNHEDHDEEWSTLSDIGNEELWQGQEMNVTGIEDSGVDNPFTLDIVAGSPAQDGETLVSGIDVVEHTDGQYHAVLESEHTEELDQRVHLEVVGDDDVNQSDSFVWNVQEITAEFDQSNIVDGDDSEVPLNITADNRKEGTEINITSDDLNNESLNDTFVDEEAVDGVVTIDSYNFGTDLANATFDHLDVGEYNFTVSASDTTAEDTVTMNVREEGVTDAQFADETFEQDIGDVMEVDIDLVESDDIDSVEVVIDEPGEYYANLSIDVADFEGDQLTLNWNSFNATDDNYGFWAVGDDGENYDVTVEGDINGDVDTTSYAVSLYHNDEATENRDDVAMLRLNDRWTGDEISNHIAPEGTDGDDLDALLEAATEHGEVAQGDYLIQSVELSGVFGQYYDDEGNFDGDAVFQDGDITWNATSQFDQNADDEWEDELFANFSLAENGTLHADPVNQTVYMVLDTGDEPAFDGEGALDEDWDVEFNVTEDYDFADEDETVETTFSVTEGETVLDPFLDDGPYQMTADENAEIRGTSTYAPGTEVNVVVRQAGVFTHDRDLVVQDDFTWAYEHDHSERSIGEEFTITIDDGSEQAGVFAEIPEWDRVTDTEQLQNYLDELVDELDVDDYDELADAVADMQDENEDLQTQIDDLNDDLADLQSTLDDAEADRDAAEDEAADLQSQLDDAESALDDAESALTDAEADRDAAEDEAADLQSQVDELNDEISQLEDDLEEAESSDDSSDDDGTPGFGIAVAITALIGAAMLALRRQD